MGARENDIEPIEQANERIERERERLERDNAKLETLISCVDRLRFPPESSSTRLPQPAASAALP
jgi:hypothetical protein